MKAQGFVLRCFAFDPLGSFFGFFFLPYVVLRLRQIDLESPEIQNYTWKKATIQSNLFLSQSP
jgi:hypothetical protein